MADDVPKARQDVRAVDARAAWRAEPALAGGEHRFAAVDEIRLLAAHATPDLPGMLVAGRECELLD